MSVIQVRPDHEPGINCPNSPATCLICQRKLDRRNRALRNCRYVRELLKDREPVLAAALDEAVRRA